MAKDNELPTLANCDLRDPEERFLWVFVGLPDVIGALLVFPIAWWRKVSAHLVKCGLMIECPECGHREQPQIKFRIDPTEDPMMGGGGRWVPADDPEPEHDAIGDALQKMRKQTRKAVFERLQEEFPDDPVLNPEGKS